ncbi:MAG: hypothetical protein HY763_14350 [Planctomycetes bacterium]|nr:hypothetical protein [Planctomycetota bacterium]
MSDGSKLESLCFLEDEPVPGHKVDELDLITFARVIAGGALGTGGPFTMGVFGDWGEGKTSILRQARSLLDEDPARPVVTAFFNAWQFEREEHPIVPLTATIVAAVEGKLQEWESGKALTKKALAGSLDAFKTVARALRAIAYGFSIKAKVPVPGFGEIEAGFVAKEMIERYDKLATPPDPLVERTLYYRAFDVLDTLARRARQPGDGPPFKIVVFVDDLDRCLPPQAVRLLESIKLVLCQPGFIFVLALDARVIRAYLTRRYREEYGLEDYDRGPPYLDKIIQLPIPIPSHRTRFEQYVLKLLDRPVLSNVVSNRPVRDVIRSLIEVLGLGSRYNPRTLVRFINNLIIDNAMWRSGGETPDPEFLGVCAADRMLREHCDATLYEHLVRNEELCAVLAAGRPTRETFDRLDHQDGEEVSPRAGKMREDLLRRLDENPYLPELLKTKPVNRWLTDRELRVEVSEFMARQRTQSTAPASEREIIESAIRQSLGEPADAPVTDGMRARVKRLSLEAQPISDSSVGHLRSLTALQSLDLSGTAIADAGLAYLGPLKGLRDISLDRTAITDAGLARLAKRKSLRGLSLDGTSITDRGLKYVSLLTSLRTLSLARTRVTDAGLRSVVRLTELSGLVLSDTGITDAGLAHLTTLRSLRALRLDDTATSSAGLEHLAALRGLATLTLDGTGITDAGLDSLKPLSLLDTLSLGRTRITGTGLERLVALTLLTWLSLEGAATTDAGLEHLAALRGLVWLSLSGTAITDAGLKHLTACVALRALHIRGTRVTEDGVSNLRRALPRCHVFGL